MIYHDTVYTTMFTRRCLLDDVYTTMMIALDEVLVSAKGGTVQALEGDANNNNNNAELKVGNNSNKMQSFLKAASVTQKFKTQLANLMTCIEGSHTPYSHTYYSTHTRNTPSTRTTPYSIT